MMKKDTMCADMMTDGGMKKNDSTTKARLIKSSGPAIAAQTPE